MATPPPSPAERRGRGGRGQRSGGTLSAFDACLRGSLGLGALTRLPASQDSAPDEDDLPRLAKAARRGGHGRGFDVHAGVVVSASDSEGRERLLRYCARPALSLERLSVLPDSRVAYALRKPWGRQTHRVLSPPEFLARLSALVPPPRHPLIRFHGLFAAHAALRAKVVPVPATARGGCERRADGSGGTASGSNTKNGAAAQNDSGRREGRRTPVSPSRVLEPATSNEPRASRVAIAAGSRIDWAELLKRVYDVDALACPCGGRLRFIALILEADTARRILDSRGLPSSPPPIARARAPDLLDPPTPDW